MATTSNESDALQNNTGNEEDDQHNMYRCHICYDDAIHQDVIVCCHVFCWPCLYQWLETQTGHLVCPVCKDDIIEDNVIPVYEPVNSNQEDSRHEVPPRPARTYFYENLEFPYGLLGFLLMSMIYLILLDFPDRPIENQQQQDEQYLSKLLLSIAALCMVLVLSIVGIIYS